MTTDGKNPPAKKHRVFYSWQSDLPQALNRSAINHALESARKKLSLGELGLGIEHADRMASSGEDVNLDVIIDQATQGLPGSPKISDAIIAKITTADVFVADISVINSGSKKFRHTPNPNVLFELGFAAAMLGWDRIILIINRAGKKNVQVPFDIQGHLYLSYTLIDGANDKKEVVDRLGQSLASAIRRILQSNPPRPNELRGKTVGELRRERDVRTLVELFSSISIPALEDHLQSAPDYYKYATTLVVDEFDEVYRSFSFRMHDPRLRDMVKEFASALHQSIPGSEGSYYRDTGDPCTERFANYGELNALRVHDEASKARERLEDGVKRLAVSLKGILNYVHEIYPDVDPEALGRPLSREIRARIQEMRAARRL